MRIRGLPFNAVLLDTGIRLGVGVVLLLAGIVKAPPSQDWVDLILAYSILPVSMSRAYAYALPWVEIIVGFCLILGIFPRFFSIISVLLVVSFIIGNVTGLNNSLDCGCFGTFVEINHPGALAIDAVLLAGSVVVFFGRRRFLAYDYWLARFRKQKSGLAV